MSQQYLAMNSILKTKTMPPPPHSKTMRLKALNDKLEKAMAYKVILVCAPAGYGKSTGVSQFMHLTNRNVAWLTIETSENEPIQFLIYLIACIQSCEPEFGLDLLKSLLSPNPPSTNWFIGCVMNQLNAIEKPVTFVFDDWHLIQSPLVQQLMDQFIAHLPATMNLVLLSRVYPNLSFNALRLKQEIVELYAEDLILSHSESLAFFDEVMNLPKTALFSEALDALAIKTEGWVAGLQMCGLFMKDHTEKMSESIQAISSSLDAQPPSQIGVTDNALSYQKHLATHLFLHIFNELPLQSQLCLMLASVANRFSTALCNDLLKPFNCHIEETFILNHLRQGHFIIALDDNNQWFRFHHLYGDFLKNRFKIWLSEGAVIQGVRHEVTLTDFQSRAANWFLLQGFDLEAFQLAAQGDAVDLAVNILQSGEIPLLYRGTMGMAREWLNTLPDAVMNTRPWLWIMLATAELYGGRSASTHHYLQHATQGIQALAPNAVPELTIRKMEITIASLRASVAVINHETEEIELQSMLALKLLGDQPSTARCPSLWALGYAKLLKKAFTEALVLLEEAVTISNRMGHTLVTIMATINIGNVYEEQNALYDAERYYMRILERTDHMGYPVSCDAYLGMARIRFSQNRFVESKHFLETAQILSHQIDRTDRKALCYEMAARLNMAEHQPLLAFIDIEKAIRLAIGERFHHRLESFYELQCQLLLLTGHVRAAQSICKDRRLSLCPIWMNAHEGLWKQAIEAIEFREAVIHYRDCPKDLLYMTILKALFYAKASSDASKQEGAAALQERAVADEEKACELMRLAISIAQQGGIVRPFFETGQSIQTVFEWIEMSQATIPYPEFKALLYDALEDEVLRETQQEYEALSQRELEILLLISEGLSNEDIAERLYLALSTVKGTNQRVFSKLHVRRRTEAVAKAKKMGLI